MHSLSWYYTIGLLQVTVTVKTYWDGFIQNILCLFPTTIGGVNE